MDNNSLSFIISEKKPEEDKGTEEQQEDDPAEEDPDKELGMDRILNLPVSGRR